MKRKSETCAQENLELDSLIENMELMNCFNGEEEYKLLKESCSLENKLDELHFKQINEILKKTFLRYKRYIINVDLDGLTEIEKGIYKFLQMYKNETNLDNWLLKYKQMINIMIETDKMILDELDNYSGTTKRYKI